MDKNELIALMQEIKSIKYEFWPLEKLVPYEKNPRKNDHAVDIMASRIKEFGFPVPICVRPDGSIADGHLRYKAAKRLGLPEVPVAVNATWTPVKIRAFRLSVNKTAELADWDYELLPDELNYLLEENYNLEETGFTPTELANLLGNADLVENPQDEWKGMPEFDQQDKTAFRSIIVHFKDNGAISEFCELLNQNITDKTKMIWFPEIEIEEVEDKRYGS